MTYTKEEAKKKLLLCNEEISFLDIDSLSRVKRNREALRLENEDLAIGDTVLVKSKKRFSEAVLISAPRDITHKHQGKISVFRMVEYIENKRGTIYQVQAQTHNVVKIKEVAI